MHQEPPHLSCARSFIVPPASSIEGSIFFSFTGTVETKWANSLWPTYHGTTRYGTTQQFNLIV